MRALNRSLKQDAATEVRDCASARSHLKQCAIALVKPENRANGDPSRRRASRSPKAVRPKIDKSVLTYRRAEANSLQRSICASSQASLASSAGARPLTRTTCATRNPEGLSLKVSDEFTVPLCAIHHHHIHTTGKEREWWQERNIDPLKVASRPLATEQQSDIPQCAKLTYRKYGKMEPIALLRVLGQVTRTPNLAKLLADPIQPKAAGHPLPHRARQGVGMFWTLALEKGQLTVEGPASFPILSLVSSGNAWANRQVRLGHCAGWRGELVMVRGLNECVHLPSRISLQSTSPIRDRVSQRSGTRESVFPGLGPAASVSGISSGGYVVMQPQKISDGPTRACLRDRTPWRQGACRNSFANYLAEL